MTDRPPDVDVAQAQAGQDDVPREAHLQATVKRVVDELCDPCPKHAAAPIQKVLAGLEKTLARYHHHFQQSSVEELTLSYASEWVLDNYYIIRQAIEQIREDLPKGYLDTLPILNRAPYAGFPRVYLAARSVLGAEDLQVDISHLENYLQELQSQIALTMGELWAVPIFLRFTLIEELVHALDSMMGAEQPYSPPYQTLEIRASHEEAVASVVISLRTVSNIDWKVFFETVSQVDQILRQDPAGIYADMEFATRDLYRKAVEDLSRTTGVSQKDITLAALAFSQEFTRRPPDFSVPLLEQDRRGEHVGFYLIDAGRAALEAETGYRPGFIQSIRRLVRARPAIFYLSTIFLIAFLALALPVIPLTAAGIDPWLLVLALVLLFIPAVQIGSGVTNWLVTLLNRPAMLPKMRLEGEIPPELHTLVTIPAMLTSPEEVASLVHQLEVHYLRNPSPGLSFALLSDFADADAETLPGDAELVDLADESIERLNNVYQRADGSRPFYLIHRPRTWNPGEGKWMGWERKRGKLRELNWLLRGGSAGSFSHITGDPQHLQSVRYVLTLDADTILPINAANRLIGTIAHPLNRAIFAPGSSRVVAGYTILQPRVDISPTSGNRSWFTRIFAGDVGLDLYSRAVSDVYQDLFGEGIFVGKGIYDLDGFERSVDKLIPENALLSHDLFEGLLGRAGLVTDISLVENYPTSYFAFALRLHRWIRGDWQLLPWLLRGKKMGVHFSLIDLWKIVDNLRRSLLAPVLMLLLMAGWTILPGPPLLWTVLALGTLAVPLLMDLMSLAMQLIAGKTIRPMLRALQFAFLRWLLAVVFLPYEAFNALEAVAVTLYRLYVSRRNLLAWMTAAHTELSLSQAGPATVARRELLSEILAVLVITTLVVVFNPGALWTALPLLLLWLTSPQIAVWMNRPVVLKKDTLSDAQIQELRLIARRTWSFFETFVGPEDHWLPPDHYQESPLGIIAHRTSPTNIGLLLTSTLAAYELGYIDQFSLVTRLSSTIETLSSLDRYRGHFINWIDTRTLQPLTPRYISTVDSGNLAACLIVTAESLYAMSREVRVFRWQRWLGYLDSMAMLDTLLAGLNQVQVSASVSALRTLIGAIHKQVIAVRSNPSAWYSLFVQIRGPRWEEMTRHLTDLVTSGEEAVDLSVLRHIRQVAQQIDAYLTGTQRTIAELVPWIPMFDKLAPLLADPRYADDIGRLRDSLPYSPLLGEIGQHAADGRQVIAGLKDRLSGSSQQEPGVTEALAWLDKLSDSAGRAAGNSAALLAGYNRIAAQAMQYVDEMDFRFLYNPRRRVFHIGFNLDAARLDDNYYDLLASEARMTSLIAIAKGDVHPEHWLHMNRPVTLVEGHHVLLSWSATMFEYLMPPMFLRTYDDTLLKESDAGAVLGQIAYGRKRNRPWGVSESGFYRFDANQNYQYRAFGVPGLGFKRGLGDDFVIAPYASLMAIGFQPLAVVQNAEKLAGLGALGLYGYYEAVDFTENRQPYGQKYSIVCSYMAHHHGMTMLALVNYLRDNFFVRRMHANSQIKSVDLLLQEQVPYAAPLQNPESGDVRGTQRLAAPSGEIEPWVVPINTSIPQVHLLSNGAFHSLMSNSGSGFLRWLDVDLTRWNADPVLDRAGIWIYLQELGGSPDGAIWSAANQPNPGDPTDLLVTYHSHMAVYRRARDGIASTLEVTIPPDDAVEIRRIHLSNATPQDRLMRLTSYGEVILTDQASDARHPAFNKLFIQSEYQADYNLLVFRRRPRSAAEQPIYLGHMLVKPVDQEGDSFYETNRARFLGRWRDIGQPHGLLSPDGLSGTTGATLDPIFSLGQELNIPAHGTTRLAWITFTAGSLEEIHVLADRYRSWTTIDRAFPQARFHAENRLRRHDISGDQLNRTLQILSALLYPLPALRAAPETIASNRRGQPDLWPFGVSGDYPILMVEIGDPTRLDLVREALQIHQFCRERGLPIDLVILNQQQTNYGAEMNRLLYRLITRTNSDIWINQRGGIFILYADQMNHEQRTLLRTAARVILDDTRGSIQNQLPGYTIPVPHLPAFIPSSVITPAVESVSIRPQPENLLFDNGYGGFSADGCEYVIEIEPGKQPPLPWSNVIGYPNFGFLVTESGSSTTWSVNSGENRLTPWSNDPLGDPSGEVLYLRDEETGDVWTPTPKPAGKQGFFRVRHGAGYTRFEHTSHDMQQQVDLFADPLDPVKIIRLRVKNLSDRSRRLTATQYVEWVLGTQRWTNIQYLVPEFDAERETLLAGNPFNTEFQGRAAFLAASKKLHGMTADRMEFIGRNGSMEFPVGLQRIGLESRVTPGDHPCAVMQVHIDLPAGEEEELYFFLGQAEGRDQALALVDKYHAPENVDQSWQAVRAFWNDLLGAVQVHTPDQAADVLLNRWLLYQALSCRIWGRTAFYQSSGAFGFRDQLQDVMAVLHTAPEIARAQILNAARHQFEAGDVLHWWHPPSGRGVRTRFSDDLLWLPYVVAEYVETTGDAGILLEEQPFRQAAPLREEEGERYGEFQLTTETYSLMEHCRRAVVKGNTRGEHGLPLMGSGDWNDGMNRVGAEGRGESVWLGWFLYDTLVRYAGLCRLSGLEQEEQYHREQAAELKAALEASAWDGRWYLRAFYDNGAPLGSGKNQECQIDAIAQSWAVISRAGPPQRARQAMQSLYQRLIRPADRLSLLFTPPFDKTPRDPGYIKGYVPGIRENGGQYTHASIWTAWAFAMLGQGGRAGELFDLLNPIYQASDLKAADIYKVEPYVIAADIYSTPPHVRRGGWTWYTGSSGWMYRLGVEALLGLRRSGDTLLIDPTISPEWERYSIQYRFGHSTYHIQVSNPDHVEHGVRSVRVDQVEQPDRKIRLQDDRQDHIVEVVMGAEG